MRPRPASARPAVAACALLACASRAFGQEEISARVSARLGRVQLVDERGELCVVSRELERQAGERAHLEVGAGSVAEIVWTNLGSARVEGPCTLEWRRAEDVLTLPGEAPRITCDVVELGALELEMRRGALQLEAPGGWRVSIDRGAVSLRAQSGGACRAELRAGNALVIEGPRDARVLWPRRTLAAGESLVLDARFAPPSRPDLARHAPRWTRVDWPWLSSADAQVVEHPSFDAAATDATDAPSATTTPVELESTPLEPATTAVALPFAPTIEPNAAPQRAPGHTSDEADRWPMTPAELVPTAQPPAGDAITRAAPEPTLGPPLEPERSDAPEHASAVVQQSDAANAAQATRAHESAATAETARELEGKHALDAHPAPEAARAPNSAPSGAVTPMPAPSGAPAAASLPFHALDWRGLAWDELEAHGAWVISRREGLLVSEHADGRITVTLPVGAKRAAWCMGTSHDVELRPGATVALGPGDALGAHYGAVRVLDALPGRPAFSAIQPPRRP